MRTRNLLVVLAITLLVVLPACAEPEPQTVEVTREVEVQQTVEVTREVTRIVEETVEVEVVVTATPTPMPPATATPEAPELGTRKSPSGIGDRLTIQGDDIFVGAFTIELELLSLVSGDDAWQMVREANMYNDPPEEGMEYILAKFYVAVLEVEEGPFDMSHAKFDAVSAEGRVYGGFISVAGLEPSLRVELYEDADHEGWTYFMVEQDDTPVAAFDRGRDSEVWFTLH